MEYHSASSKSFNTPPTHLKSKFLKISAIRLNVLKQFLSEDRFKEVLNKAISGSRVIING